MPKLALRDLFAVVTIVALALGWAVDHWRSRKALARAMAEARAAQVQANSLIVRLNGLGYLVDVAEGGQVRIIRDESALP
jgi:hypothetical protein